MPLFNFTISDNSPFITFSGSWNDTSHSHSANDAFHITDDNTATASLAFFGSAVYVFGGQGPDHGNYQSTLDGIVQNGSAHADTAIFDALLFSGTDLNNAPHQLVLRNAPEAGSATGFDIDYMVITTGDGNAKTQPDVLTLDDFNPNITYAGEWASSPNGLEQFYFMKTMHRTKTHGATATIRFQGNSVELYGATSTNHGPYSVSIDGSPPRFMNGTAPELRPVQLLYYASGLNDDPHTIAFTNESPDGGFVDLDKVVVSTWPQNLLTHESATGNATTGTGGSSTKGQAGVIAGGIIGALAGIALFLLAFYLCSRRKARQSSNSQWDTSTMVEGGIQPFPNGRPFLTIQTKAGPDWQARGDSAYAPQQGSGWTMRSMRSGSQPGIMSSTNDAAVYLTYENTAVGSDRSRVFPIDSKRDAELPPLPPEAAAAAGSAVTATVGVDVVPVVETAAPRAVPELPPPNYNEAVAEISPQAATTRRGATVTSSCLSFELSAFGHKGSSS